MSKLQGLMEGGFPCPGCDGHLFDPHLFKLCRHIVCKKCVGNVRGETLYCPIEKCAVQTGKDDIVSGCSSDDRWNALQELLEILGDRNKQGQSEKVRIRNLSFSFT